MLENGKLRTCLDESVLSTFHKVGEGQNVYRWIFLALVTKVVDKLRPLCHVKLLQLHLNFSDDPSPEQKSDFLDEIELMKVVGSHKNVVSLIGCCTKSTPNFLIVEFAAKRDLLSYLRKRRKKVKSCSIRV